MKWESVGEQPLAPSVEAARYMNIADISQALHTLENTPLSQLPYYNEEELGEVIRELRAQREKLIANANRNHKYGGVVGVVGIPTQITASQAERSDNEKREEQREKKRKEKVDQLETVYERRLLELRSAQRTLASYRKVHHLYTLMVVMSVMMTALGGLVAAFTPGDVAGWLFLVIGVISTMATGASKNGWYSQHRIVAEKHGHVKTLPQTVKYVDPIMNVELAELAYAKALRELSETTGTEG